MEKDREKKYKRPHDFLFRQRKFIVYQFSTKIVGKLVNYTKLPLN